MLQRSAISPKPRLGRCKVCHCRFEKHRAIQPVCDKFDCKVEYAVRVASKAAEKKVKEMKRLDAERKKALKPKSWWRAKAKTAMHAYVRARDEGKCCISCDTVLVRAGRIGGDYDAGHFRSVGSAKHLEFDHRNIHGQCKRCNEYLGGNYARYEDGLRSRFGDEFVDELKADQAPRHLTIEDYQAIEAEYKAKLKQLQGAK